MSSAHAEQTAQEPKDNLSAHIDKNIDDVLSLHRRQWESVSGSQRQVERLSRSMGRPGFLIALLMVIMTWIVINLVAQGRGVSPWDAPPFPMLDSLMTGLSLMTTLIVLIAQNRQSHLEQQHAQLHLQVNLLTEQKVTKLIHLMEELRGDLPMVRDRPDALASALQQRASTADVLSALEKKGLSPSGGKPGTG